ncbi:conjugal transfer protein [Paenibacillus alginolyticus]|uniref:conjugal transfer protein n=1 Tax=Paenibacillus alginolyticus TaxID=59839 RepID=UPI001FCAAF76|nr:conjugal transfer protein [Paenibacillus alginolyticus]MCY9668713.1 conjugal transfer protein [Paenibacillus alginolyticus]
MRLLPKLLLWGMLMIACLGTVSSLVRPQTDSAPALTRGSLEQQMAIHTALGFAREWMDWNGEELLEARLKRLKPYVNPDVLALFTPLQAEQKTKRQEVIASEMVSFSSSGGSRYTVHVRVFVKNPDRATWEVDVPVWVQADKGAAVTAPPLFRPLRKPPAVPEQGNGEKATSAEVKQRMRPAIESFLKAICEGRDAESLFNYVTTGSHLIPLAGRLRFVSLDQLDATGVGPYAVTVTFSAKDEATGFRFTQVWKLTVTEENQKFFVGAIK